MLSRKSLNLDQIRQAGVDFRSIIRSEIQNEEGKIIAPYGIALFVRDEHESSGIKVALRLMSDKELLAKLL